MTGRSSGASIAISLGAPGLLVKGSYSSWRGLTGVNTTFAPRNRVLLTFTAFLLAGAFSGWHVASWPVRFRYPGEENFAEGIPLAEMLHLREGVPIYAPPTPERFDAANYGPLYYLLGARLADPNHPAYLPLRLVSLAGLVGCAAGCGLLALWVGESYLAAALAPLLFLAYGFVTDHGTSARCDVVSLLLFFSGILIAYRFQNSQALLLAVPLMLMGFFYKQQFVAGPIAVVLFLLLERRYRLAAMFTGLLVSGGLALLAFFQFVAFRGQAFFDHFLTYNVLPFSWFAFGLGVLFFGLALVVPVLVALEFLRSCPNRLLSCYLGCAVFISLLTVAREGSDTQYFLECALLLSALFAALLAKRIAEGRRAVEVLCLLVAALFLGQWFAPGAPRPEDFARDRGVQDYLRRNFAPHTPALGYYAGDLVRAGLGTPISNLYHYTWLIRKGKVSDRHLQAQLGSRRYSVIVLNFDLDREKDPNQTEYYLTEPLRQVIRANYRLAGSLEMPGPEKFRVEDRFYAWVPKNAIGD